MCLFRILVPQVDEEKANCTDCAGNSDEDIKKVERCTTTEAKKRHDAVEHESSECKVQEVEPNSRPEFVEFDHENDDTKDNEVGGKHEACERVEAV